MSVGLSEAMLRPGSWSLGDKGTHYIKTIKNSSNHLATLINDILDAAAMAKGKLVIKQETVSCLHCHWQCTITHESSQQKVFKMVFAPAGGSEEGD